MRTGFGTVTTGIVAELFDRGQQSAARNAESRADGSHEGVGEKLVTN